MQIDIMVFGQLREFIDSGSIEIPDIADSNGLIGWLGERYPVLKKMKFSMAVDKKLISENTPLTNHHTVALMPPFSGG